MSHLYNNIVSTNPYGMGGDAAGRVRVSQPLTLFDYKHIYEIDENFFQITSNGGTISYSSNSSSCIIATSNTANSSAILQSKMYHNYMPGKTQIILQSLLLNSNTTNVTKRVGYFDDLNGIYLEQTGDGVLSFVIRSKASGTIQERRETQDNWNVDKFNSVYGKSKCVLDVTKVQLFFIDFQWLGVGRVRCGFVYDGIYHVAHEFYTSNVYNLPYMAIPNLPIRYEVFNTGATSGGSIVQICATVMAEGGYIETGKSVAINTGNTLGTFSSANGAKPVIAIKLKNSYNGANNRSYIRYSMFDIISSTGMAVYNIKKLANESLLVGGAWVSAGNTSVCEYNKTATAILDGDILESGFVAGASQGNQQYPAVDATETTIINKKNYITQNYSSSNSEIIVLEVIPIDTSVSIGAALRWREVE